MNAPFSVMGRTAVPRTDARKRKGEHIMADSVAQVYMIGVMCIMAFFAVSCLIGVGKAKKRKEQENTK